MEWRIFLPVSKDEPPVDIWPLFGLGKLPSETREDLYVSCTEGVGLKIRGRIRFMEIKLRGQKYACGAEQWCKVRPMASRILSCTKLMHTCFDLEGNTESECN